MSGASALAAAKRRRSKVDSNRSTSSNNRSTTSNTASNVNTSNGNNVGMPQRLNVQQSFQYIWQKVLQVEAMVQGNTNTISNSSGSNKELTDLKQKVNSIERSVQLLSSTNVQGKTVEVDGEKFVSIEQFNDVMTKVGNDMQSVSEKMAELSEFVLNVQNNNIVLRNMLDNIQNDGTFTFDDGTVSSSGQDSKLDEGSVVEESVDDNSVEDEDNQNDNENEELAETSDGISSDISGVLDKLKTLNSDEIKEEVTAELNNNITLVVEESSKSSEKESTN